jgi:ATP synthase protein I
VSDEEIASRIERAQTRRQKAAGEKQSSLWTQVARVGTLGWLIAVPIVGGTLLGHLIDRVLGTGITFSLALLLVGISIAGYALWSELQRTKRA